MARVAGIVPPKPRRLELLVMRRPKARLALQVCIGAAASTLVAAFVSPAGSHPALSLALGGMACVGGMAAVVLRFVEQPRAVALHKVLHEREPPLIH